MVGRLKRKEMVGLYCGGGLADAAKGELRRAF